MAKKVSKQNEQKLKFFLDNRDADIKPSNKKNSNNSK